VGKGQKEGPSKKEIGLIPPRFLPRGWVNKKAKVKIKEEIQTGDTVKGKNQAS